MNRHLTYKGINRFPSDNAANDGALEECVNLVNTAGELRPYILPEIIGNIDGKLLFVHKNLGYEHFIYLRGNRIKAAVLNENSFEDLGLVWDMPEDTDIRHIESVGNTLAVLTNIGVHYVLFDVATGGYRYLGNRLPFPRLLLTSSGNSTQSITTQTFSQHNSVITNIINGNDITEAQARDLNNSFLAVINQHIVGQIENGSFISPFFVRYAVELFDGSLVMHSMPMMIRNLGDMGIVVRWSGVDGGQNVISFSLIPFQLRCQIIPMPNAELWRDVIRGINIYITSPLATTETNVGARMEYGAVPPELPAFRQFQRYNHNRTADFTQSLIQHSSTFYLAATIPLGSNKNEITIKSMRPELLLVQPRMTDDFHSHDHIKAEGAFSYNNRLHLHGITRAPFSGWKISDFLTQYNITENPAEWDNVVPNSGFIFYPGNAMSVRLEVPALGNTINHLELPLKQHPFWNGTYIMTHNALSIGRESFPEYRLSPPIPPAPTGQPIYEPNRLLVSPIGNPFVFPVEGVMTLPVSRIVGVSSNTEAISTGQFGQFPLYVFTEDGIWMLEVDSQGRYMSRQPMSREVCINPNIAQLDNRIAFFTEKGLNILQGSRIECITEILVENNVRTSKLEIEPFLQGASAMDLLNGVYDTDHIEDFKQDADIAFDYLNGRGRVYMVNPRYNYAWLFDIDSRSWSKVLGEFRNPVYNYPDCYIQNNNNDIINLSSIARQQSSENRIKTLHVTRPLKEGDALFIINRLIHRGIIADRRLSTAIYGSRDGLNYTPIASSRNLEFSIRGSGFQFFKIAVVGNLSPTDALTAIELETNLRYTNRGR